MFLIEWFVHVISKDTDFKSSYSIWNPPYYFTNWLKFNADKDIWAAKLILWFYRTYAITIVLMEDSQTVWMERRPFTPSDQNRPYSDQASQSPHPKTFFDCFLFVCLFQFFYFLMSCFLTAIQFVTPTAYSIVASVIPSPTITCLWAPFSDSAGFHKCPQYALKASGTILIWLVIITETLNASAFLVFFTNCSANFFLYCHPGSWHRQDSTENIF